MRTLKKALCMVLAVVMILGLGAFGVSATSFTDDAEIGADYQEAASVMEAVKVFIGTDGKLNPKGELTRAEAATLITRLMGQDPANLPASTTYTDVPSDHWAASAIGYCESEKIIGGYGDGTFGPGDPLTGYQFAKMLLCVLGYDSTIEGLVGTGWDMNVAKLAKTSGVATGLLTLVSDKNLKREEAAALILNTLQATCVTYASGGTTVTLPDGTTVSTAASKAEAVDYVDGNATALNNFTAGTATTLQLTEKLYGNKLQNVAAVADDQDGLKHPLGDKWTFNNKNVYVEEAEADKEAVVAAAYVPANLADVDTVVAELAKILNVKANTMTAPAALTDVIINGTDATTTSQFLPGDEIEVYFDTDGKTITNVIVTRYIFAKVGTITDLTTAAADGSTKTIALTFANNNGNGVALNTAIGDKAFADFDYAKDQYVLVAPNNLTTPAATTKIFASKAAGTVEGTIDAIKGTTYRVGSTFYGKATNYLGTVTAAAGAEGTWYLDAAGAFAAFEGEAAAAAEYAYLYNVTLTTGTTNADGVSSDTYTAYVVLADGTKASYPIATVAGTTPANLYIKGEKDRAGYLLNGSNSLTDADNKKTNGILTTPLIVAYELTDGKFEINATATTDDLTTVASTSTVIDKTHALVNTAVYANDSTTFLFITSASGAVKVDKQTGYKNVNIATNTALTYAKDAAGKTATVVFVGAKNGTVGEDTALNYAVLLDATPVQTTDTDGTTKVYTYSIFSTNGDKELVLKGDANKTALDTALTTVAAGDVFSYKFDASGALQATKITGETVSYVSGTQAQTSTAGTIDISGATVYSINKDKDAVTEGGTLNATNGENGYNVYVISVPGAVKYVFIQNSK